MKNNYSALWGAVIAVSALAGAPRAAEAAVILDTVQQGDRVGDGWNVPVQTINLPFRPDVSISEAIPFISSTNADINSITADIQGNGQITIGIMQAQNGRPSGSFIDSAIVTLNDNSPVTLGNLNWAISNGATYWLVAEPFAPSMGIFVGRIASTDGTWFDTPEIGTIAQMETVNGIDQGWNVVNATNSPGAIITTSVPEASTWTMLLLGFGGIGFLSYRHGQSARLAV